MIEKIIVKGIVAELVERLIEESNKDNKFEFEKNGTARFDMGRGYRAAIHDIQYFSMTLFEKKQ